MLIVNECARAPYLRMIICNSLTYTCLTIKSEVCEAFVNPEDFEKVCFMRKLLRIYSYLRKFHEWGPLYWVKTLQIFACLLQMFDDLGVICLWTETKPPGLFKYSFFDGLSFFLNCIFQMRFAYVY